MDLLADDTHSRVFCYVQKHGASICRCSYLSHQSITD
jgi:hypothetical protein